jgi:hypothetical protein
MKKITKVLLAALLLIGGGFAACDDSAATRAGDSQEEAQAPVPTSDKITAFFDKQLPPVFDSFSFRSEYFFVGDKENKCLMINSVDELRAFVPFSVELPTIDFDQYTLIVGQCWMTTGGGFNVAGQSIKIGSKEMELNLIADYPFDAMPDITMFYPLYYWGLYLKLPQKPIVVNVTKTWKGQKI